MHSLAEGHSMTKGMLLLARALHERMSKVENLPAAYAFFEDFLPPLLGALRVEVELFCRQQERNDTLRSEEEFVVMRPLSSEGEQIGKIRIYYDHDPPAMHPIDEAFMDLVGSYLSHMVMDAMKSDFSKILTKTELKVLRIIDAPVDDALNVLQIELETLRTHKKNIYRKLGIKSSGEAALAASRLRFLEP